MMTVISFIGFTAFVAFYAWFKLRKDKLDSSEGFFLGGRSLTGVVIAGSMLLTNISTEHLVGMNGASYKNGFILIGWEITSALALVVAAVYFIPNLSSPCCLLFYIQAQSILRASLIFQKCWM